MTPEQAIEVVELLGTIKTVLLILSGLTIVIIGLLTWGQIE